MKSDVSRFGERIALRDAELRQATAKAEQVRDQSHPASSPEVGYKLPFSIGFRPFLTCEGQHSQETRHLNGEGVDLASFGIGHPISSEAPSSTFCRLCPQYGHVLIFPRKCYYEAQCPLPLLFCTNQHGEKAVKPTSLDRLVAAHPTQNFLRRLSSTLSRKVAFKDSDKVMTNFGWMKRDEVPDHLRHERGSQ
jgi:hypothetical protein